MIEFTNIDNFYSKYVISEVYDELHIIDPIKEGEITIEEGPRWRCCYIGSGEVGPMWHVMQEGSEPEEVTIEGNPKLYQSLCEQSINTVWTTEDCVAQEEEEEDDWGDTVSENGNVACSVECLNCLREAMAEHESGNDCDAVGDGGNALGLYQIWSWYIADALKACEGYGGSTPCEPCCALNDYLPTPVPPPDPNCMSGCSTQDCRNNCIRAAKAQYIWNLLKSTSTLTCEERNELSTLIISSYFIYRSQHQSSHGQGSGPGGSMTCEDLARLHNGGSTFDKKDSLQQGNSQNYWDNRIKPIMQQNCPGCLN
tara:strand:- start:4448 stop:5383 length:936 start_codon:yes stop_codon:yes gene_type:complete